MDNLLVTQVASLNAPQKEVDQVAKNQQLNQSGEQVSANLFVKALEESLREVNELIECQKHKYQDQEDEDLEDQER